MLKKCFILQIFCCGEKLPFRQVPECLVGYRNVLIHLKAHNFPIPGDGLVLVDLSISILSTNSILSFFGLSTVSILSTLQVF